MQSFEELKIYFEIPELGLKETSVFVGSFLYARVRSSRLPSNLPREDSFLALMAAPLQKKTDTQTYHTWNKITDGLYLGMMPTKMLSQKNGKMVITTNQASEIKEFIHKQDPDRPLAKVFTILDIFEQAGVGLRGRLPVSPNDWDVLGVKHHYLKMTDFKCNASPESILDTVFEMHKVRQDGHSLYIHCKAGVGRSASLVLIYLMIFGAGKDLPPGSDLQTALTHLKGKRKVNISVEQLKAVSDVILFYQDKYKDKPFPKEKLAGVVSHATGKEEEQSSKKNNEINTEKVDTFFASIEAKDAIRHLASFNELRSYASKNSPLFLGTCQRSDHIKALFLDIYNAKDGGWFYEMMDSLGPLGKLVSAHPFHAPVDDEERRKNLAKQFKDEVTQLLATSLGCTPEEIEQFVISYFQPVNLSLV